MTAPTRKRLVITALAVLLAIGAGIAIHLTRPPPATTPSEAATPAMYLLQHKQVDAPVIDEIADWIEAH